MGSTAIENLRSEFLRILDEIEKVANALPLEKSSAAIDYDSCIKIRGQPILPPVMTPEKRQKCAEWRQEALEVEERLAVKRKEKYAEAIQEQKTEAVQEQNIDAVQEQQNQRERRLSYTLEEPSPMLLAYMQRFGESETVDAIEKSETLEAACENPECVLENYLADLPKAPEIPAKDVPQKLPKEDSPGKENVPPPQEWNTEAPTWARSPKALQTKEIHKDETKLDKNLSTPRKSLENMESVTPKDKSVEIIESRPVTEANYEESLMESMTITMPSTTVTTPRVETNSKQMIESAIAALAQEQQKEIERLLKIQAEEREKLQQLFDTQRKKLMETVLNAVNNSSSSSAATLTSVIDAKRSESPVIPTVKVKIEPKSLKLPDDYKLPEAAKTPENNVRFGRLSALIKGHLTRRLLKSARVQSIITSMKDIMKIALQLHHEQRSAEDVQLHARLLHQLQKESQRFHDIFFKFSPAQKMSIIREDLSQRRISPATKQKRVSAVTMAKIQQKQKSPFKLTSRRSLNLAPSSVSSPRSSSVNSRRSLNLVSVAKVKPRKTGVKSIVHSKPWK